MTLRKLSLLLFVAVASLILHAGALSPENIIILANGNDDESKELARYYAEKRSIPEKNIIELIATTDETIDWKTYVNQIHNPLLEKLIETKWIDALPDSGLDKVGRKKIILLGHKIDALVVCRGLPLRIEHDDLLLRAGSEEVPKQFEKNHASIDSELSALPQSDQPTSGFVPNSLYNKWEPGSIEKMRIIRVTRLDGPTLDHAKALVDNALEAEQKGLYGRAYIDKGGPHKQGDEWLSQVAEDIKRTGFDLTIDEGKKTMGIGSRFDAPALYFGWYAGSMNGPFRRKDFKFPPGAIALHIHSFSATTLRSDKKAWVGPLVSRGVTATVGNVYEPYLQFTHNPILFFRGLASGLTLAEAAYLSLPAVSWQTITVGDPLYQPFKISLEEQLAQINGSAITPMTQYAVIRAMNFLETQGKANEALHLGRQAGLQLSGPAFLLKLAELELAQGNQDQALAALEPVAENNQFTGEEWFVVTDIADFLARQGSQEKAIKIYNNLLENSKLTKNAKISALEKALQIADIINDESVEEQWTTELNQLKPPPKPEKSP